MNTITDLLDLEDSNLFKSDVLVEDTRKLIALETHPIPHFCPSCGYSMHSKGRSRQELFITQFFSVSPAINTTIY